jgi:hypothetical protein
MWLDCRSTNPYTHNTYEQARPLREKSKRVDILRMKEQKESPGGEPGPDAVGWLKTVATATLRNVIVLPLGADEVQPYPERSKGCSP